MHSKARAVPSIRWLSAVLLSILAHVAVSQEGFPLDGTWRGQWGDSAAPNRVVMVMKWNGQTITGRINPGPRSVDFDLAELDPANWTVRIEATDPSGEPILVEATLGNIGSYNRTLTGTWMQGGVSYPFTMARE